MCSECVQNVIYLYVMVGEKIGGVAPNTPSTYVEGSYVLPTVVEALCERLNA